MVLHGDDASACGPGGRQDGGSVQGLDGEWVYHSDVLPWRRTVGTPGRSERSFSNPEIQVEIN